MSINLNYADNRQIRGEILSREKWAFAAKEYYRATYLLNLTDDLIESVGYIE